MEPKLDQRLLAISADYRKAYYKATKKKSLKIAVSLKLTMLSILFN
tara:strand:+ start:6902 stop:7039 length:138 start_codon:yes stop_codon:yes gene_type:complete